ncbi:hypothetical protein [Halalkalicoccus sp. NIPERK01]|uniref:hypothetical protein n=1 Tax=Halalkalicoccus sp. NIPERK01 TaxID=3053469 RepID=UPI00256EEB23|nr:hypothetical protein [Halalkalicoccus sp. NIPERK01]MDL5363824.1 hypothetical protein [Halalkalicoccus sp. NIPERK01]
MGGVSRHPYDIRYEPTDRYPDYDQLRGVTLTDPQLASILRHKTRRARKGALDHRAYVRELIDFLSHAPGTFRFEAPEDGRPTARFGRQVQDTPGHALYQPAAAWLTDACEDDERERHHAAYERTLTADDEGFASLTDDVLEIARDLGRGARTREDALEALFERLGADPTVWEARKAGHDGRVHLGNRAVGSRGIGLFRPDPTEMDTDPSFGRAPTPAIDLEPDADDPTVDARVSADAIEVRATLPEGGHVALVTPEGRPVVATGYLDPGEGTVPFARADLELADDVDTLLAMLFKGTEGEGFDLENAPYTLHGALVRDEVALAGEVAQ